MLAFAAIYSPVFVALLPCNNFSLICLLNDVEGYLSVVLIFNDIYPFAQVIEQIEFRAEDDDDCYELQNILSDPHVMVSSEINVISS